MDKLRSTKLHPSSYRKAFEDVTAQKTSRIKHLKRLVEDAKKALADSEATYEAFQAKSELFNELLTNATSRLNEMNSQDNLAIDTGQKVKSLFNTASVAVTTANDTYADTKHLLRTVQEVVESTLNAATDIALSAELIMTRKAANPLISSQLVTDASQAATDASKAVSLIVNTLTSTFNALSTANQANNTAEMAQIEIEYLKELIVGEPALASLTSPTKMPVESQVKEYYQEARDAERLSQKAADEARQQVLKSKNELTRSTANLANVEAALNAAEAAVGS